MRASAAFTKAAGLLDPKRECLIVDFPSEVSPTLEALLRTAYLDSLKLMPAAYGRVYRISEQQAAIPGVGRRFSDAHERLHRFSELWAAGYDPADPEPRSAPRVGQRRGVPLRTLERLVRETGAGAIVAPHFYGAGVLGRYKELNPGIFAAALLTDYVPHPMGVPPNLDLYIVADHAAAAAVERLGAPPDRIRPTGIPIDPAFEQPANAGGARRDLLQLTDEGDDLPVVVVMGGGLGGGHLDAVVGTLLEASAAMHLVVLCGSNEHSRAHLQRMAAGLRRPATFLGFTDQVRDLMAASAVLVTKPGGMSCTEALACGLPQVLINPIPGQEEDNAAAMVRYGAGVTVSRSDDALGETMKILTSPNHRSKMVEAAHAAHNPRSAESAARLVLEGMR